MFRGVRGEGQICPWAADMSVRTDLSAAAGKIYPVLSTRAASRSGRVPVDGVGGLTNGPFRTLCAKIRRIWDSSDMHTSVGVQRS
jgi:hypothetical protein